MNVSSQNVNGGWFDKVKHSINFESFAKKLGLTKYKLLDMALFLGIGFFVGFLWKRYANYFIALLLFIAALFVLQQLDFLVVKINWPKIHECCGVEPITADTDVPTMLWNWLSANVLIMFSFVIGFFLGLKVG